MNIFEADILQSILEEPFVNQRVLAETSGYSLGQVNKSLKNLTAGGYLNEKMIPTRKASDAYEEKKMKNAVILAAGFGMRMVPINLSAPKALLEVRGEPLIERMIRQLHEAGITDITVVTGFMKESFEYLIDQYHVELAVNPDYAVKNNLSSLALVRDRISNTYIIPSDLWCEENPFHAHEMYSWYMVSSRPDPEADVRVNRKKELVRTKRGEDGNAMIGISCIMEGDAKEIRNRLGILSSAARYDGDFWETVLYEKERMKISARVVPSSFVTEINTYEELRELDGDSDNLKSDALDVIAEVFRVPVSEITDISVLKKGMTNRSFVFSVSGKKYIMRIPGEGTDQLISRTEEAQVYSTIKGLGLCDDPIYINSRTGYKITKYLEGVRVCDADSEEDLKRCMKKLRSFHEMKLNVPHTFDIFGQIDFYERLWDGQPCVYKDYSRTKASVFSLKPFIDKQKKDWCLTHIDAIPDNFLFYKTGEDEEEALQLTDWEYSGMQDPHADIAMFCIYSLYGKAQCDRLIDIYFENRCDLVTRAKIYCYISACGLLWANWCEYKRKFGVEFGEYSIRQYRYAKDYYVYAKELMEQISMEEK